MATSAYTSDNLTSGWSFKQGNRSSNHEYLPTNDLPTSIHLDLLKNKKISDPFLDLNELSVRWIAEQTWTYRTSFQLPDSYGLPGVRTTLIFEGLDTFATVYLNGKPVLTSDNMFIDHEIDITNHFQGESALNPSIELLLEIEFEPARKKGLELVREHPEHRFIVHQTEISRGPVRKAQYHWGWDWGPVLMAVGLWKPVRLATYVTRISDIWIEYDLSDDLSRAKGTVFVAIEGESNVSIEAYLSTQEGIVSPLSFPNHSTGISAGVLRADFEIADVALWNPRGYGAQSLYRLTASIHEKDNHELNKSCIQIVEKPIGFRKIELIQDEDRHGTSFFFRVNDIPIFCGGSCWIPADSFPSRVTSLDYRSWMETAAEGNQIMVRVWGGGIYEDDAFYNAADELGILIWQDFAFACANYPANLSYLASVETEARQNVRRLRNHASLVIWAGNNEDYQIVERYGLEYDFAGDKDPQSWLKTNFPARYIYEYLLPKIVAEETKGIPYHPSSPFGNGLSTTLKVDPTVGDIHQWNMWHGTMEPYQRLSKMGGRFVSEFGMEAYPHLETLEKCISSAEDRYPGSMAMDFRNKAIGHERRLVSYVAENFRIRYDLKGFTHLTQVMQSDAMSWAYRSWRRDWGTDGDRKCGGVLVWQLNDCWPTMSWAVVDYYGVPKPAYYAIKRALEPLTVNVQRKVKDWTVRPADDLWQRDTSHIDFRQFWNVLELNVWVSSSKKEDLQGEVLIRFLSVNSGKEVISSRREKALIKANTGSTTVYSELRIEVPTTEQLSTPIETSKAEPIAVHVELYVGGAIVASDVSWPEPIKYLRLFDRGVSVKVSEDKATAIVTAQKPVKGFVFEEKRGVKLSDNGFDIMPGEKKHVHVEGCGADQMKWTYVEM